MKRKKRIISLLIIFILLSGSKLSVNAEGCQHILHKNNSFCYDSISGGLHPYIIEYTPLPTGELVPKYGMCETVIYRYKRLVFCQLCNYQYYEYSSECVHTACNLK